MTRCARIWKACRAAIVNTLNDSERFRILTASKRYSTMAKNKKLYKDEDELLIIENGEERILCGVF